jgi:hypothetical protein
VAISVDLKDNGSHVRQLDKDFESQPITGAKAEEGIDPPWPFDEATLYSNGGMRTDRLADGPVPDWGGAIDRDINREVVVDGGSIEGDVNTHKTWDADRTVCSEHEEAFSRAQVDSRTNVMDSHTNAMDIHTDAMDSHINALNSREDVFMKGRAELRKRNRGIDGGSGRGMDRGTEGGMANNVVVLDGDQDGDTEGGACRGTEVGASKNVVVLDAGVEGDTEGGAYWGAEGGSSENVVVLDDDVDYEAEGEDWEDGDGENGEETDDEFQIYDHDDVAWAGVEPVYLCTPSYVIITKNNDNIQLGWLTRFVLLIQAAFAGSRQMLHLYLFLYFETVYPFVCVSPLEQVIRHFACNATQSYFTYFGC